MIALNHGTRIPTMGDVAGRNIIVLSDGTGNSSGKLFKTNVWRMYDALDLSNATQIASYDDGVGTSSIKPLAVLGGAFGWGLKRNVLALYTFLCLNYKPGDRIYGFGFSRGAFTIRVLTKFVLSQGLVSDWSSSDDLRGKALRLYRKFRVENTAFFGLHTLARPIRDMLVFVKDVIRGQRAELRKIKTVQIKELEFLGLWDTADAGLVRGRARQRWRWISGRFSLVHTAAMDDRRSHQARRPLQQARGRGARDQTVALWAHLQSARRGRRLLPL